MADVIATVRLLHLPWWWILFPPFLDGAWNGNPQTLLVPLILVGAGPLAAFLKVYAPRSAVPDPALASGAGDGRRPGPDRADGCPGPAYAASFGELSTVLLTSSPTAACPRPSMPWLLPVAVLALVFAGRERAAWLAVPVAWPATQWYYSTLAVPALTPIAAAIMAVADPGCRRGGRGRGRRRTS